MSDLDKRLKTIYSRANRELTEKANSFFERFEEADKKHRKLVDEGKLSEKEYQKWRINTLMTGERYKQMQKDVADTLLNANKVAASYINAEMPGVYASNFNHVGKDATKQVPGYSFDLVSAQTVRKLASEDKTLLPYKRVNGRNDERWNTKKVNSEILQGIIQGESIPKIAKRLGNVTEMNKESAIRNARTAITGAQNSGRFDGMKQLEDDGVILKKEWVAAVDSHTREAHLELNGQQVDIDEPFVVDGKEIMFPGDPNCPYPELVYNCRCTMRTVVVGFTNKQKVTENELDKTDEIEETSKEIVFLDEMYNGTDVDTEEAKAAFVEWEEGQAYDIRFAQQNGYKSKEADYIENLIAKSNNHYIGELSRGIMADDNTVKQLLGYLEADIDAEIELDMLGTSSWTMDINIANQFARNSADKGSILDLSGNRTPVVFRAKLDENNIAIDISQFASLKEQKEVIVSKEARFAPAYIENKGKDGLVVWLDLIEE